MRLSKFGFTMFQVAARLITLLSVLMHAALGCCAHHDHCAADHRNASAAVAKPENSGPVKTKCDCRFHQMQSFAECETGTSDTGANEGSEDESCPCGESHGECADLCAWLLSDRAECPIESTHVHLPATRSLLSDSSLAAHSASLQLQNDSAPLPYSAGSLRAIAQVWRL